MEMENEVIFPRFIALEMDPAHSTDGFLDIMLEMEGDHAEIGDSFRLIRETTADYKLPEGACNIFRALYSGLMELEMDMKVHIHLENNILLPRVRQLLIR
jgi:regulator of cell morphogenesis and NO signaling